MSAPRIVPAAPGATCMVISTRNVQDEADTTGRATAHQHYVVAWRLLSDDDTSGDWPVDPIPATHIVTGGDVVLLPLPGGGWFFPWDGGCFAADADFADLIASVEASEAEGRP